MKRFIVAAFLFVAVCAGAFSAPRPAVAQSRELLNVLSMINQLSDANFGSVIRWARSGAPSPGWAMYDPQRTESYILGLRNDDRSAVLSWLTGSGRWALYARGANYNQIGWRDVTAYGAATPTPAPFPWRELDFASATLDGGVQGGVDVTGGFGAARRDGTSVIACVSFKNVAQKTANRVVFDFALLDNNGQRLGELTFDRRGEFSPNVGIHTYLNFAQWAGGLVNNGYAQNCKELKRSTMMIPVREARMVGYRIVYVGYDDGTNWSAPGYTPASP
jgi:hypothetical protein